MGTWVTLLLREMGNKPGRCPEPRPISFAKPQKK
jgi:hypothetical protein